jgi:hypothetical protein
MHKNAMKCNKTQSKYCINKHGASKIIDTFGTYQRAARRGAGGRRRLHGGGAARREAALVTPSILDLPQLVSRATAGVHAPRQRRPNLTSSTSAGDFAARQPERGWRAAKVGVEGGEAATFIF